jgi:predicted HTH transcriptional regulator
MEALELIDLIAAGETSTVQLKRTVDRDDKLAAELCAFANSSGGRLLFGVDDDGAIVGLSADEIRSLNSRIANVAANHVREPIFPTSEVVMVEGQKVLVVFVPESGSKPHFDQAGAIWVKNMGDKRRVSSREELRRIFQDSHVFYADEQVIVRSSVSDLDRDSFLKFYRDEYNEAAPDSLAQDPVQLRNLNLVQGSHLTLAGLLFFGKEPTRFRPEFATKAVAFVGNDPTGQEYRDSEDLDGTLPAQLAKCKAFLKRNLRHLQNGQSVNSEGSLEIPDAALEELLVNMLIHRNYFISAPQKLFVFDDRIEIRSPGCLPNSLTIEQVKAGNSIPRNPILHGLASRILPYRGIGTGIRRALEIYPDIRLESDPAANTFVAIIQRPGSNDGKDHENSDLTTRT